RTTLPPRDPKIVVAGFYPRLGFGHRCDVEMWNQRHSPLKELAAEGRAVIDRAYSSEYSCSTVGAVYDRASPAKFLTVIALAAGRPELLLGKEGPGWSLISKDDL